LRLPPLARVEVVFEVVHRVHHKGRARPLAERRRRRVEPPVKDQALEAAASCEAGEVWKWWRSASCRVSIKQKRQTYGTQITPAYCSNGFHIDSLIAQHVLKKNLSRELGALLELGPPPVAKVRRAVHSKRPVRATAAATAALGAPPFRPSAAAAAAVADAPYGVLGARARQVAPKGPSRSKDEDLGRTHRGSEAHGRWHRRGVS